jgi:ferritin-like metal-binding protein YciE
MNIDSLKTLYVHELKDLWSAEKQLMSVLPRCIDAAQNDKLKQALADHQNETEGHIGRLEGIFERLEFGPGGHKCEGMAGLLEELEGVFGSEVDAGVRDAMMIAALQRIEHYEIASYGVARTFAEKLGDYEAADSLQNTLDEEGVANRTLTRLAERSINFEAMSAGM